MDRRKSAKFRDTALDAKVLSGAGVAEVGCTMLMI